MSAATLTPYASATTQPASKMPGKAIKQPQKRILGESKSNHNAVPTPPSSKKRKLNGELTNGDIPSSPSAPRTKLGSSQPKSQFETEVLEKLTQDISGLKKFNSEKDQQWERPSLDDFDEKRDSLCFQQIEAEEGTLHGGKVTVKFFGVTEVRARLMAHSIELIRLDWPFSYVACNRLLALPLRRCSAFIRAQGLRSIQSVP